MTIEMAQFHDGFFEESRESLDAMEAALLQLDPGAPNQESINSIFRVAHSIKGGSGMFGFTEIASFTHTLETLLDELRNGRQSVTAHAVDLLLKSTDVLRGMLQSTQSKSAIDMQVVADLQFDLEQLVIVGGKAVAAAIAAPATAVATEPVVQQPQAPVQETSWAISFRPNGRLLMQGNDPIRIIAELAELGRLTCRIDTDAVPALVELDPEVCYFTWCFELLTPVAADIIRSVFDWAEGDCELDIAALADPPVQAAAALAPAAQVAPPPQPAGVPAPAPDPTPVATHPGVRSVAEVEPGGSQLHPGVHREDR